MDSYIMQLPNPGAVWEISSGENGEISLVLDAFVIPASEGRLETEMVRIIRRNKAGRFLGWGRTLELKWLQENGTYVADEDVSSDPLLARRVDEAKALRSGYLTAVQGKGDSPFSSQ